MTRGVRVHIRITLAKGAASYLDRLTPDARDTFHNEFRAEAERAARTKNSRDDEKQTHCYRGIGENEGRIFTYKFKVEQYYPKVEAVFRVLKVRDAALGYRRNLAILLGELQERLRGLFQ